MFRPQHMGFVPYEEISRLPSSSGLYYVAVSQDGDHHELIYIGKSGDIHARHAGLKHHRAWYFRKLFEWLKSPKQDRQPLPGRLTRWSEVNRDIDGQLVIYIDLMPKSILSSRELKAIGLHKPPLNVEGTEPKIKGFFGGNDETYPNEYPGLTLPNYLLSRASSGPESVGYSLALDYRTRVLSAGFGDMPDLVKEWHPRGAVDSLQGETEQDLHQQCLCGNDIRWEYHYSNPLTDNHIILGSSCVEKFRGNLGRAEMAISERLGAAKGWTNKSKSELLMYLDFNGLNSSPISELVDDYLLYVAAPKTTLMRGATIDNAALFFAWLSKTFSQTAPRFLVTKDSKIKDLDENQVKFLVHQLMEGTGISKERVRPQKLPSSPLLRFRYIEPVEALKLVSRSGEEIEVKGWRRWPSLVKAFKRYRRVKPVIRDGDSLVIHLRVQEKFRKVPFCIYPAKNKYVFSPTKYHVEVIKEALT